jgi:hypothetical protein
LIKNQRGKLGTLKTILNDVPNDYWYSKYRKAVENSKKHWEKGQFMDEKDFATQSQGSEPVEVSIWAKRAIWCVAFGYLAPLA